MMTHADAIKLIKEVNPRILFYDDAFFADVMAHVMPNVEEMLTEDERCEN